MSAPQILDSTFRTQLHTDIKAVYTGTNTPVKIHDQRPRLNKNAADFPFALVLLTKFDQQQAGLRRVKQTYTYEITFVGLLSTVTGPLDPFKVTLANLLIAQLMTGNLYAGIQGTRMVTGVDFDSGAYNSETNPTFVFAVTFQIVADGSYQ